MGEDKTPCRNASSCDLLTGVPVLRRFGLWTRSETNFARFDVLWEKEVEAASAMGRPVDILRPIIVFARPMIIRTAVLQL